MTISQELKEIERKKDRLVKMVASDLIGELTKITPEATGELKGAWELIELSKGYIIHNSMIYASFALAPYVNEGGFHQGSLKFPAGIQPTIDKYNRYLQTELNKI